MLFYQYLALPDLYDMSEVHIARFSYKGGCITPSFTAMRLAKLTPRMGICVVLGVYQAVETTFLGIAEKGRSSGT